MLTVNPKYEGLRSFLELLPDIFELEGDTIYDQRNLIKVFHPPGGPSLNVKRYHVPGFLNRLVYSSGLRQPKGKRAYDYPKRLLAKGISTPEPVAYIEERQHGLLGYSYFVSLQCDYGHTLYEMGNAVEGTYEALAVSLARFAAHMHQQEVLHKDFTPGNILWRRSSDGHYDFSLVDINRMRFAPVGMLSGLDSLKRLWGPRRFIELLVREYARQRGYNEAQAIDIAMNLRRKFWNRFLKRHDVPFHVEL